LSFSELLVAQFYSSLHLVGSVFAFLGALCALRVVNVKVKVSDAASVDDETGFAPAQIVVGNIDYFATDARKSLWSLWSAIFGLIGLAFDLI